MKGGKKKEYFWDKNRNFRQQKNATVHYSVTFQPSNMFFFSKKITIKKTRSLNKLHHLFDMSPPFAFEWFFATILTVIPKIDTIIVIVWLQSYQNPSPAISQRSELGQLAANNLQGPVPKLSSTALFCCKKESKSEKSPSPVWLSTTLISSSSWGGKNYT